ncbi:MAG: tyrosine recombinase XerC [Angelakisella sp.]|jgi:integrase/recombinase XerC|nr:tyrosine recombinase XerC [Angelakisella sp.]
MNINDAQCPQLLKDFLFYMLTIKGRSQRTIDSYFIDLRFFLRYLRAAREHLAMSEPNLSNISIEDLPREMILGVTLSDAYGFLNFVQTTNENNAATRSRKVSSLRSFYNYLSSKAGLLEISPLKDLETPSQRKSLPKYLTLEESRQLLQAIDGPSPRKERDYCMITLLLNCGMRLSELVGIKKSSIHWDDCTLVLLGKGNKERMVFLNEACLSALEVYLEVREEPKTDQEKEYLFLSKNGKQLSPRRVEQIVEAALKQAGLSGRGFSPHKLRHTAATLMYQHGGVDIRVLKEILGHENLGTTEIYTHVASPQVEDAARKNPLGSIAAPKPKKAVRNKEQPLQEPEKEST